MINHVDPSNQLLPGVGESEGHIPFTARAKEGLELALQERTHFGGSDVDTAYLLLGILRPHVAVAGNVLTALDVNPELVRQRITEAMRDAAP